MSEVREREVKGSLSEELGHPLRVFRAFLEGWIRCIDHCGKFLFYVFPYDNGPDYPSDGLIRIVDEIGLIGYEDT